MSSLFFSLRFFFLFSVFWYYSFFPSFFSFLCSFLFLSCCILVCLSFHSSFCRVFFSSLLFSHPLTPLHSPSSSPSPSPPSPSSFSLPPLNLIAASLSIAFKSPVEVVVAGELAYWYELCLLLTLGTPERSYGKKQQ